MSVFGAATIQLSQVNQPISLEVYSTLLDQVAVNKLWFQVLNVVGGGVTQGDFASDWDLRISPLMANVMSSTARYAGVGVRTILASTTPRLTAACYDNTTAAAGTGNAQVLPSQVCGLVKWQTNRPGPSGRGRMYTPFPSADFLGAASEEPTAAFVTSLNAIGNAYILPRTLTVGASSISYVAIIWTRRLLLGTSVRTFLPEQRWGTQRRRSDFGRSNKLPF